MSLSSQSRLQTEMDPSPISDSPSIGVQTEHGSSTVDVTIPLWIACLFPPCDDAPKTDETVSETSPLQTFHFDFHEAAHAARSRPLHSNIDELSTSLHNSVRLNSTSIGVQTDCTSTNRPRISATIESAATASQPRAVQSSQPFPLYNDLLQVVLRYLSPNEILVAAQLSKQWYQVLDSMPSLRIISNASVSNLHQLPIHSAIGRHIAHAHNLSDAILCSPDIFFRGFYMLPYVAVLLPNLTTMSFYTGLTAPQMNMWLLPQSLTSLHVKGRRGFVEYPAKDWCSHHLPAIGALRHLRKLRLELKIGVIGDNIDFSPLLLLAPHLQVLHIELRSFLQQALQVGSVQNELSVSLIRFVRQTRVSELSLEIPFERHEHCYAMLSRNHPSPEMDSESYPLRDSGNLTSLSTGTTRTLDREVLEILINFPSLTHFRPLDRLDLDRKDMHLLSKLPNITELDLANGCGSFEAFTTKGEPIVLACRQLPNLRKLCAQQVVISSKEMDECLSYLPHLTDLDWTGCTSLQGDDSLSPLVKYGLPQRLRQLKLKNLSLPICDFLDYILPLQHLETLHLVKLSSISSTSTSASFAKPQPTPSEVQKRFEAILPQRHQFSFPRLKDFDGTIDGHAIPTLFTFFLEQAQYSFDSKLIGTSERQFHPWIEYGNFKKIFSTSTYLSITCMVEYQHKSFEELRLEDEEGVGADPRPPSDTRQQRHVS